MSRLRTSRKLRNERRIIMENVARKRAVAGKFVISDVVTLN